MEAVSEKVSEKVKRFLLVDDGSGYGSGYGDGSGRGSGCGYVDGSGDGYGRGRGSGCGDGSGRGSGYGSGYGRGYGRGSGCGYRYGCDVTSYCWTPVYMIDGVATIIRSVFRDYAKGYILRKDLTLAPCYVAKGGGNFAHGDTLAGAVEALREKMFQNMDEDERIAAFWECHERGVKYPAADLYEWHHKLTGSCEAGRKAFARDHGVDLETDTYTVEEFVAMCKDSYGGDVIRRLMEDDDGKERVR